MGADPLYERLEKFVLDYVDHNPEMETGDWVIFREQLHFLCQFMYGRDTLEASNTASLLESKCINRLNKNNIRI